MVEPLWNLISWYYDFIFTSSILAIRINMQAFRFEVHLLKYNELRGAEKLREVNLK